MKCIETNFTGVNKKILVFLKLEEVNNLQIQLLQLELYYRCKLFCGKVVKHVIFYIAIPGRSLF